MVRPRNWSRTGAALAFASMWPALVACSAAPPAPPERVASAPRPRPAALVAAPAEPSLPPDHDVPEVGKDAYVCGTYCCQLQLVTRRVQTELAALHEAAKSSLRVCMNDADATKLRSLTRLPWLRRVHLRRPKSLPPLEAFGALPALEELVIQGEDEAKRTPGRGRNFRDSPTPRFTKLRIEPLAALPKLKRLRLDDVDVQDLHALKRLSRLEALTFGGGDHHAAELRSLDDVAELAELTELDLHVRVISSAAPLAKLRRLRTLRLAYAIGILDLSPLATLPELVELQLTYAPPGVAKSLRGAPKLESLELRYSAIQSSDLTALAGLRLKRLGVASSDLLDLAPLASMTSLESLGLATRPHAPSLAPLAALTKLTALDLGGSPTPSLAELGPMPQLERLGVEWTDIASLAPLEGTNLKTVRASNATRLRDISKLRAARDLEVLELWGTAVSSLAPIAQCSALRELTIGNTAITSVSALRKATRLEVLSLTETKVRDLTPLHGLESLRLLDVPIDAGPAYEKLAASLPTTKINPGASGRYPEQDLPHDWRGGVR